MEKLTGFLFAFLLPFAFALPASGERASPEWEKEIGGRLMWTDTDKTDPDTYVAFRGKFILDEDAEIDLQMSGASWYAVWIDGSFYDEGPDRYNARYPEYQCRRLHLSGGEHMVAIQVHFEGIVTRILYDIPPFLFFRAAVGGNEIGIDWKCEKLNGYSPTVRRLNPQLGWIEWADTRKMQNGWQKIGYDDTAWEAPVFVKREIGGFTVSKIAPVKHLSLRPQLIGKGVLAEVFGYPGDNPGASFYLRDLDDRRYPAQGIWLRYDLGRVRLARPRLKFDLPAGTVVEIAYSEFLSNGRVAPWITLSAGDSYNMDRYVARGGEQEFSPLAPRGGRFVEVHIFALEEKVKILDDTFVERCYYEEPEGAFNCEDTLLNTIWKTGVETYKACSEDALIDNPTRERGQWLGDVGIVGIEIGAVAFTDMGIIRRGLVQSAQCANEEGLVAGLCPGGEAFMSSYALQWVPACLTYMRLTGDRTLLDELYYAAERNIAAFDPYITGEGIVDCPYWNFIDWGYVPNDGKSDMALNLHYMIAVQNMEHWSEILNRNDRAIFYRKKAERFSYILQKWYASKNSFDSVGYHRTVLGLKAGMIAPEKHAVAIDFIKRHILNCFPNNPDAPRLSDPSANNPQLITPYFAHYAFPVLMQNGEADFVLDQYRTCWGWALEGGITTWIEVFDKRWTHCHQWAGSPTWQLSRYVLGLTPRFDRRHNAFDLTMYQGSLSRAEGKIPLPSGKSISVKWQRKGEELIYEIDTPEPIEITMPKGKRTQTIRIKNSAALSLPLQVEARLSPK